MSCLGTTPFPIVPRPMGTILFRDDFTTPIPVFFFLWTNVKTIMKIHSLPFLS